MRLRDYMRFWINFVGFLTSTGFAVLIRKIVRSPYTISTVCLIRMVNTIAAIEEIKYSAPKIVYNRGSAGMKKKRRVNRANKLNCT